MPPPASEIESIARPAAERASARPPSRAFDLSISFGVDRASGRCGAPEPFPMHTSTAIVSLVGTFAGGLALGYLIAGTAVENESDGRQPEPVVEVDDSITCDDWPIDRFRFPVSDFQPAR